MTEFIQHAAVQALAWTLVHFIWQGAAIGLVTLAVFRLVRTPASARYAIGVGALLAMLAAPVATFAILARESAATPVSRAAVSRDFAVAIPAGPGTVLELNSGAPAPRLRLEADWLAIGVFAWMAGVLFFALRLAGGWIVARRYARQAVQPASDRIQTLARQLADRMAVRGAVRVLESSAVAVPVMLGWLKPTIVLPLAALAGLSPAQIEALLAHELAHVRRHDYLVNLLQSAVESLLFYHPAVWWLSSRVRADRELCCDDLAIGVCDRLVYATALTDLAAMASPMVALAATDGDLVGRVRRILGQGETAPAVRSGAMPMLALALVTGIGVPVALASAQTSMPTPTPTPTVMLQGNVRVEAEPRKPTSLTFDHLAIVQTPPQTAAQTAAQVEELRKRLHDVRAQIDAMHGQALKAQVEVAPERQTHVESVSQAAEAARAAEIAAARRALEEVQRLFEKGLAAQSQVNEARDALARAEAQGDALATALVELEQAKAQLQRSRTLVEKGLVTRATVADMEAKVADLERRVEELKRLHTNVAFDVARAHEKNQADARQLYELLEARKAAEVAHAQISAEALHVAAAARLAEAHTALNMKQMGPDATVLAGDLLRVAIKGEPDLPASYAVAVDGTIRLPFMGAIKVVGLNAAQVRDAVGKQLAAKKLGSIDQVTVTVIRPGRPK